MAGEKLPRPVFNVLRDIYKRKWEQQLHFCRKGADDMNPRSFAASGARMSEALAEAARELTPNQGRPLGVPPSLSAFDWMGSKLCSHGLMHDADDFADFLQWQWGLPESYQGDGTIQEPLKMRTGLIVFTSKGALKKADNAAMVRGNAAVCLWDGDSNLGPSYWNAKWILFWELQLEGSRKGSGERLAGPTEPSEVLAPVRETGEEIADELVPEIAPEDKKNDNIYCPNYYERAPKHFIEKMEEADLRNYDSTLANAEGKKAYEAATHGTPGGEVFWGGAGKEAAGKAGLTIQEKIMNADGTKGGAGQLEDQGNAMKAAGTKVDWKDSNPWGKDSGITNERIWKTISMRSAENAEGDVTAFVAGGAGAKDRVFDSVELPTLLHNPKVKKLTFKDPEGKVPDTVWEKDEKGCWKGGDVPGGEVKSWDGKVYNNPGFSLDPKKGFVRITNKPKPSPPPS